MILNCTELLVHLVIPQRLKAVPRRLSLLVPQNEMRATIAELEACVRRQQAEQEERENLLRAQTLLVAQNERSLALEREPYQGDCRCLFRRTRCGPQLQSSKLVFEGSKRSKRSEKTCYEHKHYS